MAVILIQPNISASGAKYDEIALIMGDLHFACDLVADRQIKLARRLSEEIKADWRIHPDLQDRVNAVLAE